jgi:hypothetical protein
MFRDRVRAKGELLRTGKAAASPFRDGKRTLLPISAMTESDLIRMQDADRLRFAGSLVKRREIKECVRGGSIGRAC